MASDWDVYDDKLENQGQHANNLLPFRTKPSHLNMCLDQNKES